MKFGIFDCINNSDLSRDVGFGDLSWEESMRTADPLAPKVMPFFRSEEDQC